ncbi:MAG TPA: biosynthetic-type acetolactate synthase large subunit [Clostridia bacterium]|nr:biosynthetic-type acetolactate synthase large subunit [Clostridia bacterium]
MRGTVFEARALTEVDAVGDSKVKKQRLTGAQILLQSLLREGVDTVFGYPGGAVLPLYDELYQTPAIRHFLARHEQGAVHAADGYARSTGKPGVVFATSGPGATNLVTGIANAYMDSVPLVAITGQVGRSLIGRDSFQEADITGITLPITKYNYLVKDVGKLAKVVHEAFHLARTGRPGPVLIDIPKDVQTQETGFNGYPPVLELPGYRPGANGFAKQLPRLIGLLREARKPVIFAGGGIISGAAHRELLALAERTGIPVAHSMMGKGAFPETHPLSLGMVGMHGLAHTNYAFSECDLLIGLGVRFDDRVTGKLDEFCPQARIVHVDIDPAEINKNVKSDLSLTGDVKEVLSSLLGLLEGLDERCYALWREQIAVWRKQYPLRYENTGLKPQYIIEQIYELTGGDAYMTTDVGQHQMWTAQYFPTGKPRTFISSGGLGTMGFGFPAAIGVQVAHPEATVFTIAGDGSFQMNSQELATAVQYQLPINIAIINNGYLGMVRQWQELFFGGRYSQVDLTKGPDFVKLAEAYGARGLRIERVEDVRPALEEAIASRNTVVLDFVVEREENVFPMVPAGGALNKMMGR